MKNRAIASKKEIDTTISQIVSNDTFDKKVSIVVVPQLQLVPYVFSVLNYEISLLKGAVIIINPTTYNLSRSMFCSSNKFFSLNIVNFHERESDAVNYLLKKIKQSQLEIDSILLHPFAGSVNRELLTMSLTLQEKIKYHFYADGSRNNFNLEWNRNNEENMIDMVNKKAYDCSVYAFGFDTSASIKTKDKLKYIRILDYGYLDFVFSYFRHNIQLKVQDNVRYNLVLSRYWGRDPYLFKNDDLQIKSYWKSIELALRNKQNDIIYRGDNRSTVVTIASSLMKKNRLLDFSSQFKVENSRCDQLLMENFIHEEPEFLKKLDLIYVFDSSFPLIFQSKKLYNLLSFETIIVLGFDYESVSRNSIENTLKVMIRRISILIFDLLKLNIFRIYDKNRVITKETVKSESDLLKYFEDNDGFFYLQKL